MIQITDLKKGTEFSTKDINAKLQSIVTQANAEILSITPAVPDVPENIEWHVDAVNGLDTNPGTLEAPWKTLEYALEKFSVTGMYYIAEYDASTWPQIILHTGVYGQDAGGPWSSYWLFGFNKFEPDATLQIVPAEGATVEIKGIMWASCNLSLSNLTVGNVSLDKRGGSSMSYLDAITLKPSVSFLPAINSDVNFSIRNGIKFATGTCATIFQVGEFSKVQAAIGASFEVIGDVSATNFLSVGWSGLLSIDSRILYIGTGTLTVENKGTVDGTLQIVGGDAGSVPGTNALNVTGLGRYVTTA